LIVIQRHGTGIVEIDIASTHEVLQGNESIAVRENITYDDQKAKLFREIGNNCSVKTGCLVELAHKVSSWKDPCLLTRGTCCLDGDVS
jgi:hypothetical protein